MYLLGLKVLWAAWYGIGANSMFEIPPDPCLLERAMPPQRPPSTIEDRPSDNNKPNRTVIDKVRSG